MSPVEWHELRAPELRALAEADALVIIPVGSTEQHGPHLPVQVDARLAAEVARRAAARISEHGSVVVAPTLWCGLAEHHMAFGATITLDFATFHALIRCVCDSILRHGFRRLALLNGHGGQHQGARRHRRRAPARAGGAGLERHLLDGERTSQRLSRKSWRCSRASPTPARRRPR